MTVSPYVIVERRRGSGRSYLPLDVKNCRQSVRRGLVIYDVERHESRRRVVTFKGWVCVPFYTAFSSQVERLGPWA